MRLISNLILSAFLFPAVLTGNQLPPQLKFWRINELNGFQADIIYDIKQGPLGFIWLATNDGLYRYDGQEFLIYRHEVGNPKSLPYNHVTKLFFDSNNNFWVLTDFGIAHYNYSSNNFVQIAPGNGNNRDSYKSTNGIAEASDGTFYISTYGDGIKRYKNGEFLPLGNKAGTPAISQLILTILLQQDSILWIGTLDNGLEKYNLSSNELTRYPALHNNVVNASTVHSLFEDSKNNVWVGTNNGLVVFPKNSGPFKIKTGQATGFSDKIVLSIIEDSSHKMWVGTGEKGLMSAPLEQLSQQRENLVFTVYEASEKSSTVSYRSVNCIFQDKSNNIWLGTYHDGLNVFSPEGEKVATYQHYPNQPNSLPHNRVWGICEDRYGMIWIGTDGNGISKLNPFTGNFKHFPYQNGLSKGPNDKAILSALCDRDNNLWFGTYLGGVSFFDQQTQTFKHYCNNKGGKPMFSQSDIRALHQTPDGTIWAGTNRGGLYFFDREKQVFVAVAQHRELDIRAIVSDSQGKLWMGTYGSGGLYSYNPSTGKFMEYSLQNDLFDATPVVFSLCLESDSVLWLGSQYFGLIQFNTRTQVKKFYTVAHGLAHNTIKAIVKENQNTFWLSTEIGISSFNTKTRTFNNYSADDGFLPGLFNDNSAFISKYGYFAFGANNGLNLFYPNNLQKPDSPPSIVFTDFKLFNESFQVDSKTKNKPISKSIWIADTIRLKHNQNIFTLNFVAQDYPFPNGWHYEFILEDYDKKWNNVNGQNSSTYRNLPPGEYIYRARAVDKSNKVRGPERSILILVTPPWWKTFWAYSVLFLVLASVVWLVLRNRIEQIKLKNSLYYEKRMRQQEHNLSQEKIRFYTNFSHELRTPLSLILGPSNDLYFQSPRPDQQPKIKLIRRNADYLMELLNKLLEFRKIESNKIVLNVSKSNIRALLRQEVEFFRFQSQQKEISLESDIAGEPEGWADLNSLRIVLNNLLSNAVKFTPVGGTISLISRNQDKRLYIEVSNSGSSISQKEMKLVFDPFYQGTNSAGLGGTGLGLALCKNLVELHGGAINVHNKPNMGGTAFLVELPTSKENYEKLPHARFLDEPAQLANLQDKRVAQNNKNTRLPGENEKLVLLVDDNCDIIEYLQSILSPEYRIISANNGKTGIDLANECIPDLVISDVMMPQKSGVELCNELKNNIKTSHIPIILLTANTSSATKIEGFAKGADDYIVKPFDSTVLRSRINSLFRNRKILGDYFKHSGKGHVPKDGLSMEEEFLSKLETCILKIMENGPEITVPQLCLEMGFSRTSLYRKVRAISNLSINQIIRTVKLRKSAELLKQNKLTISEISFELGFNDLKYFRKCFKEQFGTTPSEYKKGLA